MPLCLIGLGSNLGERQRHLEQAVSQLDQIDGVDVVRISAWHETAPIGGPPNQGPFLNGAARIVSSLSPDKLLDEMQQIEQQLGRRPHRRWEARLIDLDLLLYGDVVIDSSRLKVPHPWMPIRRFVLEPAAEVAPDMVHPMIGWTVQELLDHLSRTAPYIAVTGIPGIGKSSFVRAVLAEIHGRMIRGSLPGGSSEVTDSAGHAFDREIQFVRHRAALLDRGHWFDTSLLVLSDFWFRQSLAYGRIRLNEPQQRRLEEIWSEESQHVQPQRLVVLLEAPTAWLHRLARRSQGGGLSIRQLQQLQQALRREALLPGQGPMLALQGRPQPRAVGDLIAAISAMG